jgi:hypothetical protein
MNKELSEHWNELRLLFRGGKLWNFRSEGWRGERLEGENKWRNLVEHQVTQLLAARVLEKLLGLSPGDSDKLAKVAIMHDWDKRMEIRPGAFSVEEKEKAKILLSEVNPDPNLIAATHPEFLEKVLAKKVSFLELLQFYLDDITMGSEIVSLEERINEVAARRRDLNENEELTKKLGGRKYFEVERETGHMVENVIYNILIEQGVEISSPEEIPNLIKSRLINRHNSS